VLEGNLTTRDCGIERSCSLNTLLYFHVVENVSVDCMHDISVGVAPYEVKLILSSFIFDKKYFSLELLNARLASFDYGFCDRRNKPTALKDADIRDQQKNTLNQKASQIMCLIKILPFVIGDGFLKKMICGVCFFFSWILLIWCFQIRVLLVTAFISSAKLKIIIVFSGEFFQTRVCCQSITCWCTIRISCEKWVHFLVLKQSTMNQNLCVALSAVSRTSARQLYNGTSLVSVFRLQLVILHRIRFQLTKW